jgi:hypothetical protein
MSGAQRSLQAILAGVLGLSMAAALSAGTARVDIGRQRRQNKNMVERVSL